MWGRFNCPYGLSQRGVDLPKPKSHGVKEWRGAGEETGRDRRWSVLEHSMELPEIGKRGGRRKHQDDKCNITAMEQSALNITQELCFSSSILSIAHKDNSTNSLVYMRQIMNLLSPCM